MKYGIALAALFATSGTAMAALCATPGPLLGAVAGPWGLAAGLVGYGAYRLYKARH